MREKSNERRADDARRVELEDDDGWLSDLADFSDRDFAGEEDQGGPDRRRDPLRR
jgi:hypothetical protein